jgi:hypothetical protein
MVKQLVRQAGFAAGLAAVMAIGAAASPAYASPTASPTAPAPHPGSAKAGQRLGPNANGQHSATLARQDAMLPAAQGLAAQAADASSDIAGVRLDVAAGVVHVYRTHPDQPLRLAGGLPAGVQVAVHQAGFSRSAMTQASNRLTQDAEALGRQHVSVQGVGPSGEGTGIEVSVVLSADSGAADLARASSVLHSRYGAIVDQVTGVPSRTSEQDLFFSGWRFNDYAPWFGGDRIATGNLRCTSGFAANYNGEPAMLTAAHCGGVGTNFYNGPRTDGTYHFMGTNVYSNGHTDIAAMRVASYTTTINVGGAEDSGLLSVPSWASPVNGEYLCQSGSFTGEVCGLVVVDTGQYVCLSWFLWWCTYWQGPLADVINSAGADQYAVGHGDSGGPVYRRNDNGTGTAVGLVHAVLTPNARARFPAYYTDQRWCPSPEGWSQRCASGFSFADMPGY